jgi:hypothetical protein
MNTDLAKTFEEEFLSFFSLYLMNLVFAALTMGIGLMIVVQQLVPRTGAALAGSPAIPVAVSLTVGCIAFVLGLVWITATAKLMKSVKVVRTAYRERKKREMSDEDFTGMLVHLMTQYREQKPMIHIMVVVGMVGGVCYILFGFSDLVSAIAPVISGLPGQPGPATILAIVAAVVNLVIGAACIRVSSGFRRYAKIWDTRLDALARSEGELDRMLERG